MTAKLPVILDNRNDNTVLNALRKLLPGLQKLDVATGLWHVRPANYFADISEVMDIMVEIALTRNFSYFSVDFLLPAFDNVWYVLGWQSYERFKVIINVCETFKA